MFISPCVFSLLNKRLIMTAFDYVIFNFLEKSENSKISQNFRVGFFSGLHTKRWHWDWMVSSGFFLRATHIMFISSCVFSILTIRLLTKRLVPQNKCLNFVCFQCRIHCERYHILLIRPNCAISIILFSNFPTYIFASLATLIFLVQSSCGERCWFEW